MMKKVHGQNVLKECNVSTPVLEIYKRGKRAWSTKDIWEDQKAGGQKN